jgi:Fic family protein
VIAYHSGFLDQAHIFSQEEITLLDELNALVSLDTFLHNKSFVDKFGLDFIYTSALIEGNTYDKLDTQTLIQYGRTAGGKKYSDAKMILNLRDGYEQLISQNLQPTTETLKDLHYILSDEMVPESQRAQPRTTEVAIAGSDYVPPASPQKLNDELSHLFAVNASITNPFDQAIHLHNNLAYLQYFADCNKRTARMMLNVVLKKHNRMIFIPNEEEVREYLQAIISYYETGDHTLFKNYFINNYQKTINAILSIQGRAH